MVQGVGFRPFVYRLARANTLAGWVLNGEEGVEIFLEGAEKGLLAFVEDLKTQPPPASSITEIEVRRADPLGLNEFTIRESHRRDRPTVRISPDLPVCEQCLRELSISRTVVTGIPTSIAQIVDHATQSFCLCLTTGLTPRCSGGPWTTTAHPNIAIPATGVFMHSR